MLPILETDNCSPNPCVNGNCINQVGNYMCACPAGWSGINCDAGK